MPNLLQDGCLNLYRRGDMADPIQKVWANGDVYDGFWEDDAMNGPGVLRMSDGRKYSGGFVDSLEHGAGVATDTDGTRYEGVFVEGQRNGTFIVKDADGNVLRECEYNLGIID